MSPKAECEELMERLFSFAEEQLRKHREFYPFGAVVRNDGTTELTSGYDGNEYPAFDGVIEELTRIHSDMANAGKIRVSGIAWNATVTPAGGKPFDAVVVRLEHRDNYAVTVGKPYKFGLFKKVTFGAIFATEGEHSIFR